MLTITAVVLCLSSQPPQDPTPATASPMEAFEALPGDRQRMVIRILERRILLDPDPTIQTVVSLAHAFDRYPLAEPIPEHPDIIAVVKEPGQTTIFGGVWHSDTAYLEAPSLGSLLYAKEVPATGGDTLFANMYLAYESLSPGLRRLLDGLSAVNSAGKNKETLRGDHLASGAMAGTAADPRGLQAEHPVVRRHPVTGRKALYVNRAHTVAFKDMTEAESAGLLGTLFEHAARPEFTCRFRWRAGSLALWDNRCTQHYPINDYHGQRRVMHRATIEGDRPA